MEAPYKLFLGEGKHETVRSTLLAATSILLHLYFKSFVSHSWLCTVRLTFEVEAMSLPTTSADHLVPSAYNCIRLILH